MLVFVYNFLRSNDCIAHLFIKFDQVAALDASRDVMKNQFDLGSNL